MVKEIDESKIFLTQLYPTVEKNLKIQSNNMMRAIIKFLDVRSDVLSATGPTKRLYFSDAERQLFCNFMGLKLGEIDNCINLYTQGVRYTIHKPFNVACVLAIKYFREAKKTREEKVMTYLLGLTLYSSLHVKYFEFLPNENIMNYTINNLSNKFKIKQLGTLGKAVEYTCVNTHETYLDLIDRASDNDIIKYIMNMNTRVNGFLQNIANEFYRNHKEGNYLNTEEDKYDEENYYQTDNNSLLITRLSDSITLKIISKGIDHKIAEGWAKDTQISVSALKNAIIEINGKYDKEIKDFVTCILQVYLSEGANTPRSIGTARFLFTCRQMYQKSNTSNEAIIHIKDLLDSWLTDVSVNYNKTERLATKNNFRLAVFMYYAHSIMKSYEL